MLRQLRLEMSLSQCGLAHTYPASETHYHCPSAPPPPPLPLCYLLTLPRGRMTEVFMTPPLREPSPPSIESTSNNKLAAFVAVSVAVI